MNKPKVFEFAKEIGMTPLSLMDKIREWHLPIKSHMAELDPDLVSAIMAKLAEAAAPVVVEKKSLKKKASPSGDTAPKKAASPTKLTKTNKKSSSKKGGKFALDSSSSSASRGTTVVRRKKAEPSLPSAEDLPVENFSGPPSTEPIPAASSSPLSPPDLDASPSERQEESSTKVTVTEPMSTPPQSPSASLTVEDSVLKATKDSRPAPVDSSTVKPAVVTAPPAAPSTPQGSAVIPPSHPSVPPISGAPTTEETLKKSVSPARKKEVNIGASGVPSEQTAPAAPLRRNIVGRMDLSRVQRTQGLPGRGSPFSPRGGGYVSGGVGGLDRSSIGGARPKGNLRAGFFQAPPMTFPLDTPPSEGTDDRRRDEKRRMKSSLPEGGAGAGRELEEQPPAFDAAEFRKREMVFQPKKKKGLLTRPSLQTQVTTAAAHKRIIKVFGSMKVADICQAMGLKTPVLIKALVKSGVMATINTSLDYETIALIVPEFGYEAQNIQKTVSQVILESDQTEFGENRVVRSPVIAVMGHVDHGKTSLLDAIRQANVAAGEAGGITQHIGAYQVTLDDGYKITFLDTPGHEAFTSMRARGANITDIAIIVVAADDGVMPQTAEAINHAKAAKVPMIVVVNKMDKPGANPDRIKQQLTEYEIVPEEWGGTTIFSHVSALKKTGIKELLDQIKLLAEVMELKANPTRPGSGTIIESRLEKSRGSVATILVQNGTVEVGQYIVAGAVSGRIRSLINDRGDRVESAGPGTPVEVLGLDGVSQAGDKFDIVRDERVAQDAVKIRQSEILASKTSDKKLSLEEIFARAKTSNVKELAIILKVDVAGSLEAIQGMFPKLSTPEVKIRTIHAAIGGITETDVMLASTSKGIIIGFNVRPDTGAQTSAKRYGVDIRTYTVVYEMVDEIKKAMAGLLAPRVVETVSGRAEVRNTFSVPKIGTVAGCLVADGKILRSNLVRLLRDGKIVYEGKIASLRRFKDDAREVVAGFECGIGIENFNDIKVGDVIEAYSKEEVVRELHVT